MISNISMSDFLKIQYKVKIIDIRSIQNFNHNHIENASHILADELVLKPDKYMNKYDEYYIYCQRGFKSMQVCKELTQLGYRVVNINGGYEEWMLEK